MLIRLSPDLSGGLDHQFQLAPLLVLGQQIACFSGCEAALRAERQTLDRDVLGRLVYPTQKIVLGLHHMVFGANQSQHNSLVVRQKSEWLKPACSFCVVLQQDSTDIKCPEQLLGDGFVTDFDIPFALVVPRQMCITTVASAFPALAKQALSAAIYTFS